MLEKLPYPFLTDLVLRWVSDGLWRVHEPFGAATKTVGGVVVPVGVLTDGPSIPKVPVIYEKYRDRAWPAAVVHDYLYSKDCAIDCTREQADETFDELMDALYPGWINDIANDAEYAGVRLGGASHWRKG